MPAAAASPQHRGGRRSPLRRWLAAAEPRPAGGLAHRCVVAPQRAEVGAGSVRAGRGGAVAYGALPCGAGPARWPAGAPAAAGGVAALPPSEHAASTLMVTAALDRTRPPRPTATTKWCTGMCMHSRTRAKASSPRAPQILTSGSPPGTPACRDWRPVACTSAMVAHGT